MTDKSLQAKSIDIKGKQYVLVSDRILYFNEAYPNGYISSELLSDPAAQMVVVKAKITPDMSKPERFFTGHSQAKWGDGYINKSSALENAETSAVGRALAMLGIGVIDSVASADEVHKAVQTQEEPPVSEPEEEPEQDKICPIHEVLLMKGHSKSKNKDYWYHKNTDNQICFGTGYKD